MQELDDNGLLREYAENNSEEAFATLVARHINKVYSAALRHTQNPSEAEEITQAVFVILAKKARRLGKKVVISGWLYQTARLASVTYLRSEIRRARREQEAHIMQSILNEPDETWTQIAPLLDAAMAKLNETDRHAVVLRFFDGKSIKEVGTALGTTEDTAKKRVSRALEKLQKFFVKRGVNSTTAIIAGTISSNSAHAAPAALTKSVTAVAMAKSAAASASTLTLVHGALKVMAWTKAKTAIAVGAAILLAAGTGTVIVRSNIFITEPSYQGRPLSAWLVDNDYGQPPAKRARAAKAIQKMGRRTIPFLLADLGDDRYKNIHYAGSDKPPVDDRSRLATWGFDALGPLGKPAIPELVKILHQNPGYVPSALGGIGRDALPELLSALTNEDFWVRDNTAAAIANALDEQKITPTEAQAAFPIALNNLTYTSTNSIDGLSFQDNTRWRAASLLGALHLNPDVSVPALIQGMDSNYPTVEMECAASLGDFGQDAAPAIPALIDGLNSSNSMIAAQCAMTLGNAGLVNSATAAIPSLIRGLSSTNFNVAFMCAGTLGNFSPQALGANRSTVLSALSKTANSTNAQLSDLARQSLDNIKRRR